MLINTLITVNAARDPGLRQKNAESGNCQQAGKILAECDHSVSFLVESIMAIKPYRGKRHNAYSGLFVNET
jgi:phosphoribosyl-AMP cyclohydrolase